MDDSIDPDLHPTIDPDIDPGDAAEALASVGRRREQVIDVVSIPHWYWWLIAVGMVGLGVVVDWRQPVAVAITAVVFGLGVLAASWWVATGSHRAQVHSDLLGPTGALLIVRFVAIVVVGSLAVAFILQAVEFDHAATVGMVVGALALVVGGPRLDRRLHRLMVRRAAI
jgi:hypothetical protein